LKLLIANAPNIENYYMSMGDNLKEVWIWM
jgi:hypothetical protein